MELKPMREMASGEVLQKTLAAVRFACQRSCVFVLSDLMGRTIADLAHVEVSEALRAAVLGLLQDRTSLTYRALARGIMHLPRDERQIASLASLAIREDLSMTFLPHFRLCRLPGGVRWGDLLDVPAAYQHSHGRRLDHIDSAEMRLYR
jgi:hypothetical protein